ncbi:sensor domain-containing diguanylate cyclase [Persephonella atlantica]|uniref:Diguanylate cyclase DosC n=1 Tax=Persephonella atlantica TaxID=2699429 RepID=A0ABS1GFL6_9AQUI|nr:sensor domain-containing diguanylate cyclase [Persephonella atlantica]MBK3331693.1 sensor domain-containing diguanylate cyclase [Persephonella atlantica]
MTLFEQALQDVYDDFFKNMIQNPLHTDFFSGKDINSIKEKQIRGITYLHLLFMKKDEKKLKEKLLYLGKLHYRLGIEFALFLETVNRLEILIIKELLKKKIDDIEKQYFESSSFFEQIRHYTALGYLKEYVKEEKKLIREFIEANLQKRTFTVKKIIEKHLQWEEKILDFISDENGKLDVETDFNKCDVGRWFKGINRKNLNRATLQKLEKLHIEIHHIAESIISFKKDGKYDLLVNEYHYFIKANLLFLSSLITFVFTERIKELQKDSLTGALSRSVLEDIYSKIMELSILSGQPFGIAFVDIDNFKKVNDKFGHTVGDTVLRKVAQIMKKNIRKSDYLFRYGGEEFIILTPATGKEDFFKLLERIRKEIQSTKVKGVSVTVSVGGAVIRDKKYIPLEHLIEEADRLMYRAKKEGKNRVIVEEIKI